MKFSLGKSALSFLLSVYFVFPAEASATPECLTDGMIEEAIGEQVRTSALIVNTRGLPELPLCSGLTLAQHIQRMRAAAFPEEQQRVEDLRAMALEREQAAKRTAAAEAAAQAAALSRSSIIEDAPVSRFFEQPAPATTHKRRKPAAARTSPPRSSPKRSSSSRSYYPNCGAVRAAGAAPIRRGQPGYARHLDRDGDGIACE